MKFLKFLIHVASMGGKLGIPQRAFFPLKFMALSSKRLPLMLWQVTSFSTYCDAVKSDFHVIKNVSAVFNWLLKTLNKIIWEDILRNSNKNVSCIGDD